MQPGVIWYPPDMLGTALVALLAATPVRLQYTRAADASRCVSDEELRSAVVRRLGYAPFDDTAADVLQVDVARKASGFAARLVRTSPDGARKGERELVTPRADCADLGEALAFAISVAIDPLLLFRGPALDAGESPPSPDAGEADAGAPDAGLTDAGPPDAGVTVLVEPASRQVEPSAGVAVGASWGLAPGVTLSLRGEGRLRFGFVSLGVLLRAELLGSLAAATGRIDATPLQAGLAPCVHFGGVAVCALVTGGVLVAVKAASTRITPAVSAGARVSYALRFGRFRPFAFVEGGANLARTSIFVGDTEVWLQPPAWAGGGLGLFFGQP